MKAPAKSRFVRLIVVSIVATSGLIALASPAGAVPVPWKNCGTSSDPIVITKFDASVWPPSGGKSMTIAANWQVSRDIHGASDSVTITQASGPHLLTGTLLARVLLTNLLVPPLLRGFVAAGPYQQTVTFIVPWLPAGSAYVLHREAYDENGTRLLCMDMTVPIK